MCSGGSEIPISIFYFVFRFCEWVGNEATRSAPIPTYNGWLNMSKTGLTNLRHAAPSSMSRVILVMVYTYRTWLRPLETETGKREHAGTDTDLVWSQISDRHAYALSFRSFFFCDIESQIHTSRTDQPGFEPWSACFQHGVLSTVLKCGCRLHTGNKIVLFGPWRHILWKLGNIRELSQKTFRR